MKSDRQIMNHFLVNVFNEILKVEHKCIESSEFKNLSLKEIHVIEAVCEAEDMGYDNRATAIASNLLVTAGTLTTSVSLLEKKGYLVRKKDEKDKRIVRICCTELGRRAQKEHNKFHEQMVEFILNTLSDDETEVFTRALGKLSIFFRKNYDQKH